jgi:Flp pilus assembly protein TadG
MRAKPKLTLAFDESGATAIFFVLTLSLLCGFVALAFDLGHMFMVRAELQRTADAAALAGVTGLIPYTGSAPTQTPAWASGVTKAHNLISNPKNLADNVQFTTTDGTVDYGYWLLKPPAGYVQTLPKARPTTAAYWPEPAITVTVSRQVTLSFAPVIGVTNPRTVSATAIAILPELYGITGLPPIGVAWDVVHNTVGGTMVIDASEQDIKIQSNAGLAGWFNLNGDNSVGAVSNNVFTAGTGTGTTPIYMSPGAKATLTDYITQGSTFILPVIQNDFKQNTWYPIIGWAAFTVDTLGANSMTGHFVDNYVDPKVGPNSRPDPATPFVSGTPKLVSP